MKRTGLRLVTAAFVAGSAALGFMPLAHADTTATLKPTTAAWYQPNPTCSTPAGCVTTGSVPALPVPLPDLPLSPYPAGSLHVAFTGGQETARTYLAFPVDGVTGTVTAATLDIPLDVAAADGTAQESTAKVQACLVSAELTATEGSINPPPLVTCDQHAALKYVATPAPHLHADLAPLLQGLLTTTGIALLPDATANAQTDAWHVVFSSATRTDAAKTAPPSLNLTVTADESTGEEPFIPDTPEVTTPVDGGVAAPPVVGELPGISPVEQAPTVTTPDTTAPQVPVQNVSEPQTVTVGYAYPAVWLLPLVFLLIVPAAARALTKDLTPTEA